MRLFGNPKYPRRNIGSGALLLVVTSCRLGGIYEHVLTPDFSTKDYIELAIWLVLWVLAVINVRLGIAALPHDPRNPAARSTGSNGPAA
jgi:hypothetical protein